jgi:hypothetical protein
MDNNEKQNIKNIKSVNTTRNNIMERNNNPENSMNINLKNIFEDNKTIYKTNSNSLRKNIKSKYESEMPKTELRNINNKADKINLKIKEVNDYILNNNMTNNNKVLKSLIYNDEEINMNNLKEEISYTNKDLKKSRISLFKEEISNKNLIKNIEKNRILSISPDIQNDQIILIKKNTQNKYNVSNNLKFMNNKNINISQPITNRAKNNNNMNQQKDFLNKRKNKIDIFDEINVSGTTKNILNSHTIDSCRLNNNLIPSLNDNSIFNKNKINEDKKKNNDLYQKSINGLAEEVMKPSFLKSDVSMAKLGGGISTNNSTNNDSFLFLAKKKFKNNNRKDENTNFLEIKNNSRRNSSPFNSYSNNVNNRNNKNNNLQRNRSFLI